MDMRECSVLLSQPKTAVLTRVQTIIRKRFHKKPPSAVQYKKNLIIKEEKEYVKSVKKTFSPILVTTFSLCFGTEIVVFEGTLK